MRATQGYEDQLHRMTAALTSFGKVYMYGSRPKGASATCKTRTFWARSLVVGSWL